MGSYSGVVHFDRLLANPGGDDSPSGDVPTLDASSEGRGGHVQVEPRDGVQFRINPGRSRAPATLVRSSKAPCWLAGDLRIDNGRELRQMLRPEMASLRPFITHVVDRSSRREAGIKSASTRESTLNARSAERDAQLVLAAYVKWGVQCAARLRGAFSLVLWDESAQRLVGIRDQAGIRSFFYRIGTNGRVDFSADLAWVLQSMPTPRRLNSGRIGEFLAGVHRKPSDTFYRGVKRLPAAHVLVATPSGVRTDPYWSVDSVEPINCPSDAACEERFRHTLGEAVAARTPAGSRSGVFLSGGLDSSSIAVTASECAAGDVLHTLSAVYDELEACDERPYIDDVLRGGAYQSHFVLGEVQKPLGALQVLLDIHQEPFFAPNMGVSQLLFKKAHQQNVETILHGHGGDEVISQGYGRLKELARAGRWTDLARELRGAAQIAGNNTWYALFLLYVERFKIRPAAQRGSLWARGTRKVIHLGRRWSDSDNSNRLSPSTWDQWVDPDFAADIDLAGRVESARRTDPRKAMDEAERHARVLAGPRQAHALETIARTGRHFGVETTFPFWDIDLVEYCLSLPSDQKMREGWGRWVLRRSMEGRLPPSVQWRRDKTDFTDNLRHGLVREKNHLNELLLDHGGVAKEYLQASTVHDLRSKFVTNPGNCTPSELFVLWRAAVFIAWLRHVDQSRGGAGTGRWNKSFLTL